MTPPEVEAALASGRQSLLDLAAGDLDAFELSMARHERDCLAINRLPRPVTRETRQSIEEIIAIDGEIAAAAGAIAMETGQRMGVLRRASQANSAYANANSSL